MLAGLSPLDSAFPVRHVLLAGRTGVGKSSLVNYLVADAKAVVGLGRPATRKGECHLYRTQAFACPVVFYDTWGIEIDKSDEWLRYVRALLTREASQVQTIVYCVMAGGHRVQPFDLELIAEFQRRGLHVLVALTKCDLVTQMDCELLRQAIPPGVRVVQTCGGGKTRAGVSMPFGKTRLLFFLTLWPWLKEQLARVRSLQVRLAANLKRMS